MVLWASASWTTVGDGEVDTHLKVVQFDRLGEMKFQHQHLWSADGLANWRHLAIQVLQQPSRAETPLHRPAGLLCDM